MLRPLFIALLVAGSIEGFDHGAGAKSQHAREMAALLGVEGDARARDGGT